MGLTPKMIKIIREEIVPELKREGVKNNKEFDSNKFYQETNIELTDLTSSVCSEELPEEYYEDWMKEEIEWGIDEEQLIHNMVMDWLHDEDW